MTTTMIGLVLGPVGCLAATLYWLVSRSWSNKQKKNKNKKNTKMRDCSTGTRRWSRSDDMTFHYCGGIVGPLPWNRNRTDGAAAASVDGIQEKVSDRPLLLLFGWLHAKSKQIEKYRQFWYRLGFDVLTIRTTNTCDVLWPTFAAEEKGRLVLRFLKETKPRYDQILIHSFSIGAFQSMEFRKTLAEWMDDPVERQMIQQSIRAQIFDSTAFMDELERSFSIAITQNPIKQTVIRYCFRYHLILVNWITSNHYASIQEFGFNNQLQVPALLLYSKNDPISDYRLNDRLFQQWSERQIYTHAKCWECSSHVQHYRKYPNEYREVIEHFLDNLPNKLTKQNIHTTI